MLDSSRAAPGLVGRSSKEVSVFTKNSEDSRIESQGGSSRRINKPNTFKEITKNSGDSKASQISKWIEEIH